MNHFHLKFLSILQRCYYSLLTILFGSKGKILVYHEVDAINRYNVEESCFCSLGVFSSILDKYKEQFVSIDDFLDKGARNKIIISFDDVPESVYENAYPLLKERSVPFVIYVCPKMIGKDGFLTKAQIIEMANDPLCTVGAHTMNHTRLRYEPDSYSDIYDSKIYLENLTGKVINHLAYPFGRATSVSKRVIKEVRKAGFKSAVSTIPTEVPARFNPWYIPRLVEN